MKKYLPLLLVFMLALLLTACVAPGTENPTPTPSAMETTEETPAPTPTETPPVEPTETPAGSFEVYTDWSKLEPYEPKTAVYTRRYEDFTDTLIPANDYGTLLAFAGVSVSGMEKWEYHTEFYDSCLFGLVTTRGEVVVDPVFTSAYRLTGDVILLGKVFYEEGHLVEHYALCAGDGSWCTDFIYRYNWENYFYVSLDWGIPLLTVDGRLALLDLATGEELRSIDLAAQASGEDYEVYGFNVDPTTGYVYAGVAYWSEDEWGRQQVTYEYWCFDLEDKAHPLPAEVLWVNGCSDGLVWVDVCLDDTAPPPREFRDGYVDEKTGEWAIEPIYISAQSFVNGVAPVNDGQSIYFINTAGEAITGDIEIMPELCGGYWYVSDETMKAIFDENAVPVTDSPLLGCGPVDYRRDDWVCVETGTGYTMAKGAQVYNFPRKKGLGRPIDVWGDRVLFEGDRVSEDLRVMTLTDLEGTVIAQWDNYSGGYFTQDMITGESYLYLYVYGQYKDATYDVEGNCVDDSGEHVNIEGGLVHHRDDSYTTLTDLAGNVVFCWPIHAAGD